jgi:hypothetical protein
MDVEYHQEASGSGIPQSDTSEAENGHPLFDSVLKFFLFLYAIPNLPRKTARDITNKVIETLIVDYTAYLKSLLTTEDQKQQLKDGKIAMKDHFRRINSEYKLLKELAARGFFIAPEKVTLDSTLTGYKRGFPSLKLSVCTSALIPLLSLLQKIFEIPKTYHRILAHVQELAKSKVMKNFIQTDF